MTRDAFGMAYQSGYGGTVRFLIARGAKQEVAREAAQAAWARGWERLHQLRDESMVTTWVNTIALNMFRNALRDAIRIRSLGELRSRCEFDHAAIHAAQVLRCCPVADRHLLEQQMAGATALEIARDQGATEAAVRVRLLRARRSARARMERPRAVGKLPPFANAPRAAKHTGPVAERLG